MNQDEIFQHVIVACQRAFHSFSRWALKTTLVGYELSVSFHLDGDVIAVCYPIGQCPYVFMQLVNEIPQTIRLQNESDYVAESKNGRYCFDEKYSHALQTALEQLESKVKGIKRE